MFFFDLLIAFFTQKLIPYLGFFPYKEILIESGLPKLIYSFANFDGAHYLLIAKNGYTTYQQAFFPLYPLLIRWLSPIFSHNLLLTGLIISNISFLLGLFIFFRYLKLTINNQQSAILVILFLVAFPTSFFFGAVYTEGLFFLLFICTLYFLKKEKYQLVIIFSFLASLTKLIGIFLIIPMIFHFLQKRGTKNVFKFLTTNYLLLTTLLSPLLGLGIYAAYLWITTKDPLFFLHSQWAFGAHRSSNLVLLPQVYYRYFNIFFTAAPNFQYFISLFEFLTFNMVLVILILDLLENSKLKIKNYNRLGLCLFSLINLLLPTLTGTFSSIPRYALFSLSFFLYLGQIENTFLKLAIALIFFILHILFLSFFIQGYFIS